jgi:uncharacterized protein (DUF2252 family)
MNNVIERIKASNASRLPDMLPLKYNALKEGVFRFYRGTAPLFYEDLSKEKSLTGGSKTWICGDLHLENYGTYKGDNRLIYFDINDFDECVLAPVSVEILRMLTSMHVAAQDLGLDSARTDVLADAFLTRYFKNILAGKPHSFQRETADGLICDLIESVGKRKNKEVIDKRTEYHNGMMRISIIQGKTIPTPAKKAAEIKQAFISWNETRNNAYELIDVASRIMGTGSLGMERYILLCFNTALDKPLLLDLKEAGKSCVLSYFDFTQPSWASDAMRVIKIQSLLQDTPPALLHDFAMGEKSYVIKELQPSQDKLDLKAVSQKAHKFEASVAAMADITASAHLRATGRYTAESGDALIESVRSLKKEDLLKYAKDYSKRVESDFREYIRETN